MPRRLTIPTKELGDLQLYVIYQYGASWEAEWRPMQGHPMTSLFTEVSKGDYDFALKGWTFPLVKALGLSPKLVILKIPAKNSVCFEKAKCPMYEKQECSPRHSKMPWCFQPAEIEDQAIRRLISEAIRLWREQVYIVVVKEPEDSLARSDRR